jgi:hypothetical protein
MDDQLLIQTLADIRNDLREMERRLGLRMDNISPRLGEHERRIGSLETTVTAMDSQRKTILGIVAFAASTVGGLVVLVVKHLFGG